MVLRIAQLARRASPVLVLMVIGIYAAGQAWTGEHGLEAAAVYSEQAAELEADIAALAAERELLDGRATRLREASLDLDYVDERARALTGVADRRDVIIPAL